MSDIVKIIFDGDLTPLQQKQALAKGELNAFVAESEAEIKGISGVGAAIGISAQKGAESFSNYYKPVINDISRQITSLGAGFEKVLGAEGSQKARTGLEDLGYSLKKLNLVGYEAAASDAAQVAGLKTIQKELTSYQLQLAEVTQEHIFLAEAANTSAVAQAESAVAGRVSFGARPLQGYGGLFRATGLTNAGVNETEANAALQLMGKLGVSISSLIAVGGVAAIGVAVIGVTSKLKEESEKRLAVEEQIAGAINKQVFALQDSITDYERYRRLLEESLDTQEKIAKAIKGNHTAELQGIRDEADATYRAKNEEAQRLEASLAIQERILALDKARKPSEGLLSELGVTKGVTASSIAQTVGLDERGIEKTKRDLAEVQAAMQVSKSTIDSTSRGLREVTAQQNTEFDKRFEEFKKNQEETRKTVAESYQRILSDSQTTFAQLKQGLAGVLAEQEISEKDKQRLADAFKGKIAASIKEGIAEAQRAVKQYTAVFEELYAKSADDNPFAKQMAANSKSVENLKEKLKGATPELKALAAEMQESANQSKLFELSLQNQFQIIDYRAQESRFRDPTQKEQQAQLNRRLENFARESNSTNPDVFYRFQQEQKNIDEFNQKRQQDIIDQKLDVAAKAKTDDQKAIADKAVTSFAGSLNPDDLTQSERSRIADAFERSAVRNEKRQEDSLALIKNLNETLLDIAKNGLKLSNIAQVGGKTALDITLKDDTSDKKATSVKTATPEDVSLGYASGPGGLTNR